MKNLKNQLYIIQDYKLIDKKHHFIPKQLMEEELLMKDLEMGKAEKDLLESLSVLQIKPML